MIPLLYDLYVAACNALWALALSLGVILVISLLLGVMTQARFNHARKRAQFQGEDDAWSL
jgi:ABC-type bacteriocin/lantibiotic exporter with double-glycine peptidase domain